MPLVQPSEGLEELVDADSGREIVVAPAVVNRFAELTKKYEQCLELGYGGRGWVQNNVQEVVLPCDINLFLQQTRDYEHHANYSDSTGYFITQLIQDSYNQGNNNFEIDVNALKPVDNLAANISGTKERTVNIIIKGKVGNWCGFGAQHTTFTIEKAENWCGWEAQHSIFTIEEAGNWCGKNAKHSTFTIEEAGEGCGGWAQHSTFNTPNSNQYERFKDSINKNYRNTIYLLSSDGSILKGGPW